METEGAWKAEAARLQKNLMELRAQYDRDVGLLNQRLERSKGDAHKVDVEFPATQKALANQRAHNERLRRELDEARRQIKPPEPIDEPEEKDMLGDELSRDRDTLLELVETIKDMRASMETEVGRRALGEVLLALLTEVVDLRDE